MSTTEQQPTPTLQIVGGQPNAEEIAVLTVVLMAAAGSGHQGGHHRRKALWGAPGQGLRTGLFPRTDGWRTSGLPR